MKLRIVLASHAGPSFYEYSDLAMLAQALISWGRAGCSEPTASIWKRVVGKWVPLNDWAMK